MAKITLVHGRTGSGVGHKASDISSKYRKVYWMDNVYLKKLPVHEFRFDFMFDDFDKETDLVVVELNNENIRLVNLFSRLFRAQTLTINKRGKSVFEIEPPDIIICFEYDLPFYAELNTHHEMFNDFNEIIKVSRYN